jgi:hypothetical protein
MLRDHPLMTQHLSRTQQSVLRTSTFVFFNPERIQFSSRGQAALRDAPGIDRVDLVGP